MPPAGFEPTIPASELPHTYASDRAATGIGLYGIYVSVFLILRNSPFAIALFFLRLVLSDFLLSFLTSTPSVPLGTKTFHCECDIERP